MPRTPSSSTSADTAGSGSTTGPAASGTEPAPVKPELFDSGCDKRLPAWGVTRQFDFGQFVRLYDTGIVDSKTVTLPIILTAEGQIYGYDPDDEPNIVSKGGSAAGSQSDTGVAGRLLHALLGGGQRRGASAGTSNATGAAHRSPRLTLADAAGGVPLDLVLTAPNPIELVTRRAPTVVLSDLTSVLDGGAVANESNQWYPLLDDEVRRRLWDGQSVTVLASTRPGPGSSVDQKYTSLRLTPHVVDIDLDEDATDTLLATREVRVPGADATASVQLSPDAVAALLAGRPATTTVRVQGAVTPLWLRPKVRGIQATTAPAPAARRFVIRDLESFIVAPVVPAIDASALPVPVDAALVRELRTNSRSRVTVAGTPVELTFDPAWSPRGFTPVPDGGGPVVDPHVGPGGGPGPRPPGGGGGGVLPEIDLGEAWWHEWEEAHRPWVPVAPGGDTSKPGAQKPRPKGLPVAVFLPWRQQWHLDGFSRGNLVSSIALAPGEETRIRISSWERRAKALEQSTETDIETTLDFSSTTRDTEDVFREMSNTQNFQWQLHGDVDAQYNTAVASIDVKAGGSVADADTLTSLARDTRQHLQETTRRASTRVRSRRITKITEVSENVRTEEVVRQIRNTNSCHTLTLDYYERLAHYTVTTDFLHDRVKVVVMIENPLGGTQFDSLTVRTNENTLRLALLNPELREAFEACRLLASYEHAWTEAEKIAAKAKEVAELDRQREKSSTTATASVVKPDPPQMATVLALLKEIKTAAGPVLNADIKFALDEIITFQRPVEGSNRQLGQRWLFRTLVEAKIGPAFINKLRALVQLPGEPKIEDASAFVAAIPTASFPTLKDLNNLKDTDKEDAALSAVLHPRDPWPHLNWAWWTGSCREEGLYQADDNGIAGACDRLVAAWRDYQAKMAEGDALLAQQELVNKANAEQAQANWVDKLEMKYGLDLVADARERQEALLAHLGEHADYYRYVLFQALPPGEQLRLLTASAPQLKVGYFEPRVVAMDGPLLALPLTPVGQSDLLKMVKDLQKELKQATHQGTAAAEELTPDKYILPTPGLTVETSLGRCSGCGPHEHAMRDIERRRAAAQADLVEEEVRRRRARVDAKDYDDPAPGGHPLWVHLEMVPASGTEQVSPPTVAPATSPPLPPPVP